MPPIDSEIYWDQFNQRFSADCRKWHELPYAQKTNDIPIRDIETETGDEVLREEIRLIAMECLAQLNPSVKKILRVTGSEIWTAVDLEALARKEFETEEDIQAVLKNYGENVGRFILPQDFTGNKPVIFLPYRNMLGHSEPHDDTFAHETGHLLDWYLDFISESPDFKCAFDEDHFEILERSFLGGPFSKEEELLLPLIGEQEMRSRRISISRHISKMQDALDYFIHSELETFAQIYAATANPARYYHTFEPNRDLYCLFPNSFAAMRNITERLHSEIETIDSAHRQIPSRDFKIA